MAKTSYVMHIVAVLVSLPPGTSYQFYFNGASQGVPWKSFKKSLINGVNRYTGPDYYSLGRRFVYSYEPWRGSTIASLVTVTSTRTALYKKLSKPR
jgi:hypothetical protein